MRVVRWRDLDGFECPTCRGHLVRAKALRTFLERHGPDRFDTFFALARSAPPSTHPLTCSACGTGPFRALRRGVVEIDVCASCSCVYFDEGEAKLYLRQSMTANLGRSALETSVDTVDGLGTLLGLISDFLD